MRCRWWIPTVLAGRLLAAGAEPPVSDRDLPRIGPTAADSAAATFAVRPGFHAELVAAEPLVTDPVAMAFDEAGRLYVVEMRDYSERRPERLGRVRRLEDTDGDGRMDRAVVYLDDLPWPTAVTCWNGGIFVGSTPDLIYARDTDGDGRADVRETVFTGFASDYAPYATNRLNVQALMNSLQWGPDQRIHGATSMAGGKVRRIDSPFVRQWLAGGGGSETGADAVDLRGRDFSFDPRRLDLRPETGGGQHGMTFGPDGDRFVCSNSDHLQWIRFDAAALPPNPWHDPPAARVGIAVDGPAAPVFRRSPDEPWRVIRTRWRAAGLVPGPVEGGGRPSGYFTGATGVTAYRGDAYSPEHQGDVFVADCGSNLIHRKRLHPGPDGIQPVGERLPDEQDREFLASTDTWFRPVQFINAPDGCLWVADMYREVIEHPWSLPDGIKARLDLNSGNDRGRIWRLAPDGFHPAKDRTAWTHGDIGGLVDRLDHPDGWHRDTAGRLLLERADAAATATPALRDLARRGRTPAGRAAAISVLASFGSLSVPDLVNALGDASPVVQARAVALVRESPDRPADRSVRERLQRLAAEGADGRLRLELIQTAAHLPAGDRPAVLGPSLDHRSEWLRSLAIHAAGTATADLATWLNGHDTGRTPDATWSELAVTIARSGDPAAVETLIGHLDPDGHPGRALAMAAGLVDGLGRSRPGGEASRAALIRRLTAVTGLARRTMTEPGATRARISAAAIWMIHAEPDRVRDAVPDWLAGTSPAHVDAALSAVDRLARDDTAIWATWLARWERYPDATRRRLASVARRRTGGAAALVAGMESGRIRAADLDASEVQALRRIPDPGLRERVQALLGDAPPGGAALIETFLPALAGGGDPELGHRLFRERCASCHSLAGEGVAVGPDLGSVAANGPEKLLVAILDPNREVAPNLAAWRLETVDGEFLEGLRLDDSDAGVRLRQAGGAEMTVERSRIRRFDSDGRSLMPEGLSAGMKPADMAALLAWIQSGGRGGPP